MIKLQCACGHTLELPANLAGKQVRCKRCNKVLKVPEGASPEPGKLVASGTKPRVESPLLVQGSRRCPGCAAMYPPAIVVCVACGLNVDNGAMLYASLEETKASAVAPPRAPAGAGSGPSLWQRIKRAVGLGGKRS